VDKTIVSNRPQYPYSLVDMHATVAAGTMPVLIFFNRETNESTPSTDSV
jgi:hypothetical protein